jgi:mannose-6-phosphate isomerase-like protein (cupin superfamily)
MKNIAEYMQSGILESYVMGTTDTQETAEVEEMAAAFEEIRKEIDEISDAIEHYGMENAIEPNETIKPFLFAIIDYTQRLKNGEEPSSPPILHEGSKLTDYTNWLNRDDMVLPKDFSGLYAKIICYTPDVTTAIVWIKEMSPQEMHHDEFERFLIAEGTCTITIEDKVHELNPGDFLAIPLYKNHFVKVTSDIPCKAILQRIAA